jgi:type II secretory pathway pseudopilin PulG
MSTTTERLPSPRAVASSCSKGRFGEGGFTLVEVMICTLILTTGMVAIAGLLAVTTQMHVGAREAARSTRLAQEKIDELMKRDFDTDGEVSIGGSLTDNQADHFEENPDDLDGITVRWTVADGPIADTRRLTVRVDNLRAQQYGRRVELSTIIRYW